MEKKVFFLVCALLAYMSSIVRAQEESPILSFAVISDIHIQRVKTSHTQKLIHALLDLNEMSPKMEALIINGDLTEGQSADYLQLKQILQEHAHPKHVFFTIGNHEFYKAWVNEKGEWSPNSFPNGETEQASLSRFLDFIKETNVYYERKLNGLPFVFLGSEHYRQSSATNKEDAFLSVQQLNWLNVKLEHAKHLKQPIFVFLHQPLPQTVSGTYGGFINQRPVIQHKQLRKILSHYSNVFLFSGHTHLKLNQRNAVFKGEFTAINSSSVAEPWEHDADEISSVSDSEGVVVEVFPHHLKIKGRDFSRRRWIHEDQYDIPLDRPWYDWIIS